MSENAFKRVGEHADERIYERICDRVHERTHEHALNAPNRAYERVKLARDSKRPTDLII